jgi:hypothetical protein
VVVCRVGSQLGSLDYELGVLTRSFFVFSTKGNIEYVLNSIQSLFNLVQSKRHELRTKR